MKNKCSLCSGKIEEGTTTFTVDYGKGLIVVRNVPAQVCAMCGEAWIEDPVAERLEGIVQTAKVKHCQLEVVDLAA